MALADELNALQERALAALAAADAEQIAEWKTAYLGKKGELSQLSRGLGALSAAERPAAGQAFNAVRQALEQALATREEQAKRAARMSAFEADQIDVTMPGRAPDVGRLHPITRTLREIFDIFGDMGFQIWESPEVETDELNYGLLNFPPDHPARDMQDTFYVETPPGVSRWCYARTPRQARFTQCAAMRPTRFGWCCRASAIAMSRFRRGRRCNSASSSFWRLGARSPWPT